MRSQKPLSGFDVNRYTVEEPSGEAVDDVSAWKKTIETAQMQLEYQRDK